jgi:hypothetical protein
MHRYLIIILLLIGSMAFAQSQNAARIGTRSYTEDELAKGFSAYLEFKHIPHTITKADSLALYEQYFEELIAMYIYNQAIAEGKVEVRIQELDEEIRRNPPLGVRQIQDLQTNGRFDHKKYEQALRERPAFKQEVMDFSRDMFSYRKLLEGIRAEAKVNEDSLRSAWLKSGQAADATILHFDYTRFRDIVATEEEVWALYEEIKDAELKRADGRSLYYVRFSGPTSRATASEEAQQKARKDSQALHALALEIGLVEAAQRLDLELSETQMFSLSDPFIRGIGREPALINAAFANPVGTLFEPHTGMMGDIYVCAVARSMDTYYEEFRAQEPILQHRANSLKRMRVNREYVQEFIRKYKPGEYLEAARRDSIRVVEQAGITLDSSFAPIGHVAALNRAILSTPEGEFTALIEDAGMYYLAKVTKRELRYPQDWEQQKDQVLSAALTEAQTKHLDAWYLAEKAKLEIVLPEALRAR